MACKVALKFSDNSLLKKFGFKFLFSLLINKKDFFSLSTLTYGLSLICTITDFYSKCPIKTPNSEGSLNIEHVE